MPDCAVVQGTMDPSKVVAVLEGTMNPTLRKEAESKLDEMYKIVGFSPLLMQLIMSDDIVLAVRQSGAIYLKNMCTQWWHDREENEEVFSIHENDRALIRENIVEAIIHAPDIIRNQLTVIVYNIIKYDYPGKWPAVVDKISVHLQSDNHRDWMGALLTLYQLVKNYEYKKVEEREPLIAAMKIFLPVMLQLCKQYMSDPSAVSVLLQKQLLKIIYSLIQYNLPMQLFNEQIMDEWIKIMSEIIQRGVPEDTLQVDELERPDLPWWKCKKWAIHILARIFERYGSPGCVSKEYNDFSEFFLKRYTVGILQVILKVLDGYRKQEYVSQRVLQQALHFLEQSVSHSHTWKLMKGVYQDILKDIIFPLMCFTDEDQEVWEDDPHEYIRMKFDVFEDFLSPCSAAKCLLYSACSKRKQVLQRTMSFCYTVLTGSPATTSEGARKKDGALHIIGALGETLLKKKIYKDQIELLVMTHVLPEIRSQYGYMRARSCWVTQHFSEAKFRKKENILAVGNALKQVLVGDPELPVRVEAAMALQSFLNEQEVAEKHFIPEVRAIIQALLQLVHETENDDLTTVVQKVICLYCEHVIPYAVEITQNLTMTFLKVVESCSNGDADNDDTSEDKAVTAMGILSTIETILEMMEEEREITVKLEEIIAPLIAHVLKNRIIDYYEEIFSLMHSLTCQAISLPMWEALPLICQVFQDDGFDYFVEMMPCLHNYCTIGSQHLLANPNYLEAIFTMCKTVLEKDAGEDAECHAAKLIEVIILQCRGQIDQCIPSFVEAALARLTREVKTSELRTMCLQVVIAALYYNPMLLILTLNNMRFPNTTEAISEQFFRQWVDDVDCFLGIHDRRVCVLGLCTLMDLPTRPDCINELTSRFLPSLIMLLQGLIRAYKVRGEDAASSNSDSSDEDDEDEEQVYEQQELASDEDEVDEESAEYLEMLERRAGLGDDDEDELKEDGETMLEVFASSLEEENNAVDEFMAFRLVLTTLESRDPTWYNELTSGLSQEQRKSIQELYVLADQRMAAAESKRIEKTGGYQFATTNVPTTFNFASGRPATLSP